MKTHPLIQLEVAGIKLGIQLAKDVVRCGGNTEELVEASLNFRNSLLGATKGLSPAEETAFRNGANRGFETQLDNPSDEIEIKINNLQIQIASA